MYTGRTLHILNGDATRDVFKRTPLKDEHQLVWREMLCEGPVSQFLHDPAYWKTREEYICNRYGETPEGYFDKVIMEQIRLEAFLDDYSDIVLWFEHDLFCQINLIAVIVLLYQRGLRATQLHVVSIDKHPEHEHFKGYGELAPRQLHELLEQKVALDKADLQFARMVWNAYCNADPMELEALASEVPTNFPFLANTIKLHLLRLPERKSGLGIIDRQILELALTEPMNKYELVRKLLAWDLPFGMADTQYFALINRLRPLLNNNDTLLPNKQGLQALKEKLDFQSLQPEPYQLGGIASKYRWDKKLEQVVKV